jgi:hypothetical protein
MSKDQVRVHCNPGKTMRMGVSFCPQIHGQMSGICIGELQRPTTAVLLSRLRKNLLHLGTPSAIMPELVDGAPTVCGPDRLSWEYHDAIFV